MAATISKPKGGKPDKLVRDALMAAIRQDPAALKRIAEAWLKDAETDQQARNGLADRIDGKSVQQIEGTGDDGALIVQIIRYGADASNE